MRVAAFRLLSTSAVVAIATVVALALVPTLASAADTYANALRGGAGVDHAVLEETDSSSVVVNRILAQAAAAHTAVLASNDTTEEPHYFSPTPAHDLLSSSIV